MDLLRAHVIRCADMRESKLAFLIHDSCQPKISEFHVTVSIQKYVARFEVPMEDFLGILALFKLLLVDSIVDLCGFSPPVAVIKG